VLSAATIVAKHTSALCNTCRMASQRTGNPVAKRHFVQSAKDVANNTANLVRAIKVRAPRCRSIDRSRAQCLLTVVCFVQVLDSQFNDQNRARCAEAAKPLLQAVDELSAFASSPEFASVPAKISPMARKAQEPIVQSARTILEGACSMVMSAKQLAVSPRDPHVYQNYSAHSHNVSEGLKHLVGSIK
jgi:talin